MASPSLIALGSNLGDRLANLRSAVAELDQLDGFEVTAVSSLYETAPVGGPEGQGPFYNAALTGRSSLEPGELLRALHRIEADQNRQRVVHWGPRTLDLDLLIAADHQRDDPDLTIPHPRMHERRFVLVPVCDVAAEWVHPSLGRTMRELLAALPIESGDLTEVASDWARTGDGARTQP